MQKQDDRSLDVVGSFKGHWRIRSLVGRCLPVLLILAALFVGATDSLGSVGVLRHLDNLRHADEVVGGAAEIRAHSRQAARQSIDNGTRAISRSLREQAGLTGLDAAKQYFDTMAAPPPNTEVVYIWRSADESLGIERFGEGSNQIRVLEADAIDPYLRFVERAGGGEHQSVSLRLAVIGESPVLRIGGEPDHLRAILRVEEGLYIDPLDWVPDLKLFDNLAAKKMSARDIDLFLVFDDVSEDRAIDQFTSRLGRTDIRMGPSVRSEEALIASIEKSRRDTIVIVGHCENGMLCTRPNGVVDSDSVCVSIDRLRAAVQQRNRHIIVLGCNTGYGPGVIGAGTEVVPQDIASNLVVAAGASDWAAFIRGLASEDVPLVIRSEVLQMGEGQTRTRFEFISADDMLRHGTASTGAYFLMDFRDQEYRDVSAWRMLLLAVATLGLLFIPGRWLLRGICIFGLLFVSVIASHFWSEGFGQFKYDLSGFFSCLTCCIILLVFRLIRWYRGNSK